MNTLRLPPAGPAPIIPTRSSGNPARVALVGAHGHGRWHLRNLLRTSSARVTELVAVCDRSPVEAEAFDGFPTTVEVFSDLDDLLDRTTPEIVVICTPIHTHADLAVAAMRAGAHVLLEKPPAPSRAEYEQISVAAAELGRGCQIGFQDLASTALPAIDQIVRDGTIGRVVGIGGACVWVRPSSYFSRAPWAGKREVDGRPVVDGALTNPFAHAVASALRIADAQSSERIRSIEVELYRANDIEADDTSCVRIVTAAGLRVTVGATLCAPRNHDPRLVLHGTRGRVTLLYKTGDVVVESEAGTGSATYPRLDLLENLAHHAVDPDVALLSPITASSGFMEVVETIRKAPDPEPIPSPWARTASSEAGPHVVVDGVEDLVTRASEEGHLFSELGAPWAAHTTPAPMREVTGS